MASALADPTLAQYLIEIDYRLLLYSVDTEVVMGPGGPLNDEDFPDYPVEVVFFDYGKLIPELNLRYQALKKASEANLSSNEDKPAPAYLARIAYFETLFIEGYHQMFAGRKPLTCSYLLTGNDSVGVEWVGGRQVFSNEITKNGPTLRKLIHEVMYWGRSS